MNYASCCVLSFDRPRFLRTCVETLRENAGAPLELIVHDDGSSDPEVRRLLSEWVDEGIVSTLIANPPGHNQGQGVALNRMFGMASGDPILKLDQDLVFEPGWLARAQEILDRDPSIGLLGLFKYAMDPVDYRKTRLDRQPDPAAFSALPPNWSYHTHICGSCFAMPRESWRELGPFEEHSDAFAEDWTMQKKVTASGRWRCALPDDDLCHNQGFGVGPSTVVVAEGEVAKIHKEPHLHVR